MCMRTMPQGWVAQSALISAEVRPVMSLMMSAPAASAAAATEGCRVSMESSAWGNSLRRAAMTGAVRRSSSAGETGMAPGRVDSPPMSMMWAPWLSMVRACSMAAWRPAWRPPSEKESGVTLRIPMMPPVAGISQS